MRRWPLLVLPVVLLLAHNAERGRERDDLRDCVTRAEGDVRHLVAKADAAAQYVSPQLLAHPGLERIVTGTVAQELPAVVAAREGCEGWRLPGGGAARRAYLAYLDARIASLRAATSDVDALHAELPERAAAEAALRDAFPDGSVRLSP